MLAKGRILRNADATPVSLGWAGAKQMSAMIARCKLVQAHQEGAAIQARAKRDAERIVAEAEAEAEQTRRTAYERGLQEGHAEALAQAVAFHAAEGEADERALDRVITMAQVLAERLVGSALELHGTVVQQLANQVLAEVKGARSIVLFVSEGDRELILEGLNIARDVQIEVKVRDGLGPGEMRLETDIGSLDARLGSRLQLLTAKLREGLGA